jgi:hypothetical protein
MNKYFEWPCPKHPESHKLDYLTAYDNGITIGFGLCEDCYHEDMLRLMIKAGLCNNQNKTIMPAKSLCQKIYDWLFKEFW